MLPEHVKLLRDWAKEDMYENKMEPDEQQLEVMNEVMAEAMEFGKSVAITYYRGRRYQIVIGTIHYWDEIAKNSMWSIVLTKCTRLKFQILLMSGLQMIPPDKNEHFFTAGRNASRLF